MRRSKRIKDGLAGEKKTFCVFGGRPRRVRHLDRPKLERHSPLLISYFLYRPARQIGFWYHPTDTRGMGPMQDRGLTALAEILEEKKG